MPVISDTRIMLDYTGAKGEKLLGNLSGVAAMGEFLWTVSDEGRTLECLRQGGGGYALAGQFKLDEVFPGIPGLAKSDELDLESIDIADGVLWLSGSHCRVRAKPRNDDVEGAPVEPNSRIKDRPSRTLFGRIALERDGGALGAALALPFEGPGGLRAHLAQNAYLEPFLKLPSKENGLDIEGLAMLGGAAFLGLRGPLIDSYAVAVEISLNSAFQITQSHLHFIDLGGLGIRDLARDGGSIVLIAGPVTAASGPFGLYRWTPKRTPAVQKAELIFPWPAGPEKPEGLCVKERGGKRGAVILYDSPDGSRVEELRYSADWLPL